MIQLCDKTLDSAEKNACPLDAGCKVTDLDNSQLSKGFYFRIWRCSMMLKAYIHLGKFEEGLSLLEQQEEKVSAINKYVLLTTDLFTLVCPSSSVNRNEKGNVKCEYLTAMILFNFYHQLKFCSCRSGSKVLDSLTPLAAIIREPLHHKVSLCCVSLYLYVDYLYYYRLLNNLIPRTFQLFQSNSTFFTLIPGS